METIRMYSFEDISLMFQARDYLTKERFVHFFTSLYDYGEDRIKSLWELWGKFPHLFRDGYKKNEDMHLLFSAVIYFMKQWQFNFHIQLKDYNKTYRDERLIIYLEGEEVKKAEIDLLLASDIILYAKLLQRATKVHAILPFLEELDASIYYSDASGKRQTIKVYDQDLFTANDDYWRKGRSTYFVADVSNGSYRATYKKLLYIKGKGYINNDGEPNYDESESYNYHVLTMSDRWAKIGNLITDFHLLKD